MARQPRRSSRSTRGYDRTDRLNELLRRILAEELEHPGSRSYGSTTSPL